MAEISVEQQLEKMRRDWDERAKENARYYVNTATESWTDDEFFASGERTVAEEILTDITNICQGKSASEMRVLEIGCGAGRVTRALARLFGEVHAVDVSGEMVRLAKQALAGHPRAFVYQNDGKDLSVVPELEFDFAFFEHRVPAHSEPGDYRELRPGGGPVASPGCSVQVPVAG